MSADFPMESLVSIIFDDYEGKTKMTVEYASPESKERDQAEEGWNESFDKLAESLQ